MKSPIFSSADMLRAAVALGAIALASGTAVAQGATVFREVRLDLSGLPSGAVEAKRDLGACLSRNLPLAFAGRVNAGARGAPVLIVRPTSVWLSAPVYGSGDDRGNGRMEMPSPDFMEGEAIVGATRIPISVSGAGEMPSLAAPLQQASRRTDQLCQSFAYWLARRV
jgi:hypothetical protein